MRIQTKLERRFFGHFDSMAYVDLGKKKSECIFGFFFVSIPRFVYLSFCFTSCLCYVVVAMFSCLS